MRLSHARIGSVFLLGCALAGSVALSLSCAKHNSCSENEIVQGDYDVSYTAVTNDCGSQVGLDLPTKVTFGEATTLNALNYSTESYALRGCPNSFEIDHYNAEWRIILTGERFEEDGKGRVQETATIRRFALEGFSLQSVPACSASATIEFVPRVTATTSSDSSMDAGGDR